MDTRQAREALGAMDGATRKFGESFECPPWRHAVFGAVMAGIVFSISLPEPWHWALFAVTMISILPIMRSDRRRNGVFVNGWRLGRTLPISLLVALLCGGLAVLSASGRGEPVPSPRSLLAAALAFAAGTLLSIVWQRIYVAELRKGAGQ